MKKISGIELIKMIQTGKLKTETELRIIGYDDRRVRYEDNDMLIDLETNEELTISWLIDTEFEIISENKEIDIENIEELDVKIFTLPNGIQNQISYREQEERTKINEKIKAIKKIKREVGKKDE